jgi:uncharacterized protein YdeI (BOF family)
MAQANYTPVSLYYSTTVSAAPTSGNLVNGELAINITDGKLYYKDNTGTVQIIATKASTTNVSSISFGSTGLTPSTTTTGVVTVAGTLATTNGGTGLTAFTSGGAVYASSTSALVTGTLPVASGGTGVTTSTGTGAVVLSNTPTLVTPVLGVASATTVNKVTFTAPATGSTLTIADGKTLTASNSITIAGTDAKTLTVNNSLTLDGTDSTTMTFPPASASVGYLNIPINSQSANYTTVLADSGKTILHPSTDANARTFTIDSNANVAYALGTAITFINMTSQVVTIAITSDTMYLAGLGTTGSRSLAQYGIATAVKLTSTTWIISGNGVT